MVELVDSVDLGTVTSVKVLGRSDMQWKEASTFYRIVIVVGLLCALASFILSIIDLVVILPNIDMIAKPLWGVFCLSQGILYWKSQQKWAIFWFIFSGLYFLLSIVYLFI